MASDNRANYAVIGFTVLAGIVATAIALVYLGGVRGRGGEILAETYYDRPVTGLSVGSDVNFRGVKIGKVREISFVGCKYGVNPEDSLKIYILMALNPAMMGYDVGDETMTRKGIEKMVDGGLTVTVSASGITGVSRIECDTKVRDAKADFVPSWRTRYVYIPSRISLLENFSESATKVMNQINRMDFAAVWSNIHSSVESLSRLTYTTEAMIEGRQDEIDRILGNVDETTQAAKELVIELKRNPSLILRNAQDDPLPETSR